MNKIKLNGLKLKTFTEQDALDYCLLNNININITEELYLENNELTDISGIKLFKNLKELYLYKNNLTDISILKYLKNLKLLLISNNPITDISIIQYLNKLEELYIQNLELESDQIEYINNLKNLYELRI